LEEAILQQNDAWHVIGFVHHLMHPLFIGNLYQSWGLDIDGIWILLGHWA
jgi:hypothetical protein